MEPANYREYQAAARERLSWMVYDYYAGGADDELALRENARAFERIKLRTRVMRDVVGRPTTTVLGERLSMPVLVAPTVLHWMAHPDGKIATARAA